MSYKAPIADILFTLNHVSGFSEMLASGAFEDLDADTVAAILEEAGKFAAEELAPINKTGDVFGARLEHGKVTLPPGWREAFEKWRDAGWASLPGPREYGGQGLPCALGMAVGEMWGAANVAFSLGPMLTQGAVEALSEHGSDDLKARYLPKMISGEWMGTMQLTEPQAGSDMRFLKAKAIPQGDGTYRITGSKIFITYGEHELTGNIIHMVLARLPDAPAGVKGISLFLVPKLLVNDDGSLGERNDVVCSKLEHKMGIHASPTCVMNYGDRGGAVAWLVGEPNRGLNAMFTLMNRSRLGVGLQGVGLAERACQAALEYARERRQGGAGADASPIIEHADVRRMLLNMKAKTAAARAICYACATAIDGSACNPGSPENVRATALAALLTPLAKAFSTDVGVEVTSDAIQVFGGMGYIEETGVAQYFRDARIAPIYEGTNGIQAIDLAARKLPMANGEVVRTFISGLKEIAGAARAANVPQLGATADCLDAAIGALSETSLWMGGALMSNRREAAFAGATPYLRLFSLTTGAALLTKGALSAMRSGEASDGTLLLTRHFAEHILPETLSLKIIVTSGYETVLASSGVL
jgi:acyl-CoA dehydrogenase